MTDEAQTNEDVQLTINDLMVMTFDKLNMICEDFIAKNQKPESEPAEAE